MIKISVLEARAHPDFTQDDFASLKGLTVDQAKARAKQLGHTGTVTVTELSIDDCKAGTVCEAVGDMAFDRPMTLFTNTTLSIAPPPD